jgi:C_GCAxxG_C_C family probable redox protein
MGACDVRTDPASLQILLEETQFMHKKGYNCSEAVVWALSRYWDLGLDIACATGLGGGLARTGATCGSLGGAIIALGAKVGRVDPGDDPKKQLCYRLGQRVIERFSSEMGSPDCRDILGFVLAETGGPEKYAAGGFKDGKCKDAVATAVKAAVEAVESLEERS